MKINKKAIIGIVIILLGIWGGAFLCKMFPVNPRDIYPSPYNFASFVTGCLTVLLGGWVFVDSQKND